MTLYEFMEKQGHTHTSAMTTAGYCVVNGVLMIISPEKSVLPGNVPEDELARIVLDRREYKKFMALCEEGKTLPKPLP